MHPLTNCHRHLANSFHCYAGYDTTGNTMTWTIFQISQHPKVSFRPLSKTRVGLTESLCLACRLEVQDTTTFTSAAAQLRHLGCGTMRICSTLACILPVLVKCHGLGQLAVPVQLSALADEMTGLGGGLRLSGNEEQGLHVIGLMSSLAVPQPAGLLL